MQKMVKTFTGDKVKTPAKAISEAVKAFDEALKEKWVFHQNSNEYSEPSKHPTERLVGEFCKDCKRMIQEARQEEQNFHQTPDIVADQDRRKMGETLYNVHRSKMGLRKLHPVKKLTERLP